MEFLRKKLTRIMVRARLVLIVMLLGISGSHARAWSQADRMTVKTENVNLVEFFGILQQKTDLKFVFNHEDVQNYSVCIEANDKTLSNVLDIALDGKPLKYEITPNHVIISHEISRVQQTPPAEMVKINGVVRDRATNAPIKGVSVIDIETNIGHATGQDGRYELTVPKRDRIRLRFQFLGMKPVEVAWTGRSPFNVYMEEEVQSIGEVVITGFFERKAESFTGSASTFNRDQLRNISSGSVLESLRSLDPAVNYITNDLYGSDPNRLPDISIRGKTSVIDPRDNLTSDPNQPLYILDGFQVSASQIANLNLNRIENVTILKDAASTAIYGAQAANGVIVIETVKPKIGRLRVEYNGTFSAQFADLSDYNLMNAKEKIEVELLSGAYNHTGATQYYMLQDLYNDRLENVLRGVDTYWLKVPLRNGFTNKHNVYVSGGDQTVLYGLGATYSNTQGVMKKSGNENTQFNFNLQYRAGQFNFSNRFTLENHQAYNPPVSFTDYAKTNPYNEITSGTQEKFFQELRITKTQILLREANPLYNETLNHINETRSLVLTENFYVDWRPLDGLRVTGRFQAELSRGKSEFFKSPFHTDFTDKVRDERGRYEKSTTDRNQFTGNITASYNRIFNLKHQLFANAQATVSTGNGISDKYIVTGFSDDVIPYPAFASQYLPNSVPSYSQPVSRRANFFIQTGYVYDSRYSFDFTVRQDGTSNYGREKLFKTFWSAGAAWSLHKEAFLLDKVQLLKLRFSIGQLGNDNANYTTETIYKYFSQGNLFGSGLYVSQYGNYWLDWEQTLDMNAGLDFATNDRRFSMSVDVYQKITDPLIVNLDTPASTARSNMKTNLGRNTNKGVTFDALYNIINNHRDRVIWGVGVNGSSQTSEYSKMGNLDKLNKELRNIKSLKRFQNGASSNDIWAVRSAGIDPSSGKEIYIKKDGSYTFTYDPNDEVVVGNSQSTLIGRLFTNVQYKGFSLSLYMNYRFGEDYMNTTLQQRTEGLKQNDVLMYNQDKRALYDRWKSVGDESKFKDITAISIVETNRSTDRFIQKRNWLSGESISLGYSFDTQSWLRAANIENITVRAVMNDLFHWSTVKIERGTEYPYARTASLNVSITF